MNRAERRSKRPHLRPDFSGVCEYVTGAPPEDGTPYWSVDRCGDEAVGTVVVTHLLWGGRRESFGFCPVHVDALFADLQADGFIPCEMYER